MRRSGVLFLATEPILTSTQLDKLADIFIALGQLSFGSMILPFILPDLDQSKLPVVLFGIVTLITSWSATIIIARRIYE